MTYKIEELFDCKARGIRQRTFLVEHVGVIFIQENTRQFVYVIPSVPAEITDQQDIVSALVDYIGEEHGEELLFHWDQRRRVWLVLPAPK